MFVSTYAQALPSKAHDLVVGTAKSGEHDELGALEQIGTPHSFARNKMVYCEGDRADYCYKVVSGAVRLCKVLADGRRHVLSFHFAGDFFGLGLIGERLQDAEAVDDAVVTRYPRAAIERLAE